MKEDCNIRYFDVFFSGPLRIYTGYIISKHYNELLTEKIFSMYLIILGIFTIIFNGLNQYKYCLRNCSKKDINLTTMNYVKHDKTTYAYSSGKSCVKNTGESNLLSNLLNNMSTKCGKYDIHRLYNMLIMYPLNFYISFNYTWNISKPLFLLNIITDTVGLLYNIVYYFYEDPETCGLLINNFLK